MNGSDELTDRLRAVNPVPRGEAEGWSRSPDGVATAEEVRRQLADPSGAARPRSRRKVKVVILVAAALGAATVVGVSTVGVIATSETAAATVACFTSADREDRSIFVIAARPGPVRACIRRWHSAMGEDPPTSFATCTLEDGSWGVVPTEEGRDVGDLCDAIGGRPADPA